MNICKTIAAFRAARAELPRLGVVPTMGFLHEGHLSLVRRAKADCGSAAATIFVNPTQFGPHEDFGRYPRALPHDLELLESAGTDLVFVPDVPEIYPNGFDARIDIGGVTQRLEGEVRPGHFTGVATICAKLFNITQPSKVYFGQKDAQQCVMVQKLVRDLNFPCEVVVCPTVREADGLAMSSRNAYLTPSQRAHAGKLYRALQSARLRYTEGERDAETLRSLVRERLANIPEAKVDYVSIADPQSLEELSQARPGALVLTAVRLGATRLIDNIRL